MAHVPRTFKIEQPFMKGDDVKQWQHTLNAQFRSWNIDHQIKVDGVYGLASRSFTATVLHGMGIAQLEMADGVAPELRVRVRNKKTTVIEKRRFVQRIGWRRALRKRFNVSAKVSLPVANIIEASWGFHPPGHDGLDVICAPNSVLHAMVKSKVIRADNGGWWGKAPSGDITLGDGIVILEILENVGPFKKGDHIGYGHAEHDKIKVGQIVEAGEPIALAGLAVAWHIHLMWNRGSFLGLKGRGDGDPAVILNFARKHA